MSKETHCPLCGYKEHYETETSLYECSNRRCKLSGLWFSGPEWRRLCKGSQPRKPNQPEQPLEMVTLRDRFAMAALTGLIVAYPRSGCGPEGVERDSFLIADKMMKERKTREDK